MSKFLPPESVQTLEKHLGPEVTQILVKAFDEVEARFAELERPVEARKDMLTDLDGRPDSSISSDIHGGVRTSNQFATKQDIFATKQDIFATGQGMKEAMVTFENSLTIRMFVMGALGSAIIVALVKLL